MTSALMLDWLDSLAILRRAAELQDVRGLVDHTLTYYSFDHTHRLVETKSAAGILRIGVHHAVKYLPQIERIEVWTYAACIAYWLGVYPGNPAYEAPREAFQNLCRRAGCWHTNTPDIRERWRLLDFETPAHLLPNACFESRPKCKLCSQPVASGAGSTEKMATVDVDYEHHTRYRADLHEECDRYIHRVMLPMRQAQIDAEKLATTGGIDK